MENPSVPALVRQVFGGVAAGAWGLLAVAILLFLLRGIALLRLRESKCTNWFGFAPVLRGAALGDAAGGTPFAWLLGFVGAVRAAGVAAVLTKCGKVLTEIVAAADSLLTEGQTVTASVYEPLKTLTPWLTVVAVIALVHHILSVIALFCVVRRKSTGLAVLAAVLCLFLPFLAPLFLFAARKQMPESMV